jgi:membrane fusion protein, multidrug efflux system
LPTDQNARPANEPEQQNPAPRPGQHKGVRIIVWIVLLLIFGVGFFLVLRQHDNTQTAKSPRGAGGGPVTLTTATAKKGDIGYYLDAIGTVTPVYTTSITSQVNGIIVAVHYREGQIVHKGDPLVDIDPRPYQATLLQAQGTLERDENILGQAKMDVERYRDAWARKAIPKQTLDDQEKIVLQNDGTVKLDQGMVQYDQVQLDFCHITSPIDGRVGLRLVDPGNVVQSSGSLTLVVVAQVQPITVIFTISQDNLGQVQQQLRQNAKLTVDALDPLGQKKITTGKLQTLDNQIDTTTGTVKGRALFDNKDAMLFPNQFVNIRLLVYTIHDATLIPSSAIQHNGKTAFVFVIQDGVAHMRTIQPGVTDGGTTQVTDINPGDVVANSSFDKLQDNSKVTIANNPPANSSAPASNSTPSNTPTKKPAPANKSGSTTP